MRSRHVMPFGAELAAGGETRFRLWAPGARKVELCVEGGPIPGPETMLPRDGGWFELAVEGAGTGTRYRYLIDGAARVPDPASRFQPEDVHGSSEVIDPLGFSWTDDAWAGRPWPETVLYELHVGTFTAQGGFDGVRQELDHLARLGVTALELMPLADAPGRRNWGYDGVLPFAPESGFGRPEALKSLIDAAHRRGLMVFLDVVYNHFGPDGNYLHLYAPQFFTERHRTPWGAAINFDGGQRPVRDFFIHNALYWIEEFHIDGLRLDAVHAIRDDSAPDILTELATAVATGPGRHRHVHLVLENDANASRHLERAADGTPLLYAAQWNDDLHHALHVTLTGEAGGYYDDYAEAPVRHLGRCLAEGFAYQGEASRHRGNEPRGAPSAHLPPSAFVGFLQNHDQIGNRAFGERIVSLAAPEAVRAATAILLLAPSPPLLFMGEEWGSVQPFPFFCDFADDLADAVREGRRLEFARFPEFRDPAARARIPDPNAPATFARAVLDWTALDSEAGRAWLAFHRDLLVLRRREITPHLDGVGRNAGAYRLHGDRALTVEWHLADGVRLTLCANLDSVPLNEAPPPPRDRPVFAEERMRTGIVERRWPPWSVAWFSAAGAASP